ncbi:hypothetical protein XBP1_2730001 [Xenorhabdus bovienii str. puntauvense]|uniref:Transcriptional regulator n=1 Tax=Xenorhabdus bovienii str. puntauvense TaxID=1398201 RepID=A0A077NG09_XENBV|nr:hypothetical protein XBFFR1_520001 [Xenorhabdus bovienii str. feltiae France]CDG92314.1 hypothetical protein XBFFL1_2140001 [Xenorhabdus bovienii str. feltiae Florida]CDG97704.1 hypothetical protein XBP1_2730001 [Xenorhabdus bovienii str. puntauvense]
MINNIKYHWYFTLLEIKKCNNSDCFYAINKFFLMFILALKLAKTLGITVEELFFLESSEK